MAAQDRASIRELVIDDEMVRIEICWSVFQARP
jgi:hypothetical protein